MLKIKKINFGSFIKLCALIAFSLGVVFGVCILIMSLLGGNVYGNLGYIQITGISGGIINMFLFPIIISIIGILFSIVTYLLFKFINIHMLKGIKLRGDFSIIEEERNTV